MQAKTVVHTKMQPSTLHQAEQHQQDETRAGLGKLSQCNILS